MVTGQIKGKTVKRPNRLRAVTKAAPEDEREMASRRPQQDGCRARTRPPGSAAGWKRQKTRLRRAAQPELPGPRVGPPPPPLLCNNIVIKSHGTRFTCR